jgi:hypothetical protein
MALAQFAMAMPEGESRSPESVAILSSISANAPVAIMATETAVAATIPLIISISLLMLHPRLT